MGRGNRTVAIAFDKIVVVLEKFADLDVVVTDRAMQTGDFAMEECQFVVRLSISFVEYLGHGLMPVEEMPCDR